MAEGGNLGPSIPTPICQVHVTKLAAFWITHLATCIQAAGCTTAAAGSALTHGHRPACRCDGMVGGTHVHSAVHHMCFQWQPPAYTLLGSKEPAAVMAVQQFL